MDNESAELARRQDLRDRTLRAFAEAIPDIPEVDRLWRMWGTETMQEELRWLVKEGNEAALVAVGATPRARDVLVRRCAISDEDRHHQLAAWVARSSRGPS